MIYNPRQEYAQLRQNQEKEREILVAYGVSESEIEELHTFDKKQLNGTRNFYHHLDWNTTIHDTDFSSNAIEDDSDSDMSLKWLNEIENDQLLKALRKLSELDKQILNFRFAHQYSFEYISWRLDKPAGQVRKRYYRLIKKLKNF